MLIWKTVGAADVVQDFLLYTENELRQLILGIYRLRMTQFYCQEHEHFYTYWGVDIFSRHVSVKQYKDWIGYKNKVFMDGMVSA